jgi:hypothetical protein
MKIASKFRATAAGCPALRIKALGGFSILINES